MLRSKATPCGGAERGSSFESCTSQCLVACDKSSACTTAVVRDKVGGGRVCMDGRLGQDGRGACVPEFGKVKDAWHYFAENCNACGDSDACQAACKVIMDKAPFVVDETRAHPDVCPSFDCPDCVGSCTSCSATDCVQWCDARHAPTAHCVAGNAVSVKGLFEDRSLEDRATKAGQAMGTFYDNQCKSDSVRRAQDYFAAFMQPLTRVAPAVRRPARSAGLPSDAAAGLAGYFNERVRRAEQLRGRQLDALGIGSSLRSFSARRGTTRPTPATLPARGPAPVLAPAPAPPLAVPPPPPPVSALARVPPFAPPHTLPHARGSGPRQAQRAYVDGGHARHRAAALPQAPPVPPSPPPPPAVAAKLDAPPTHDGTAVRVPPGAITRARLPRLQRPSPGSATWPHFAR
jgi:hypothetical protein